MAENADLNDFETSADHSVVTADGRWKHHLYDPTGLVAPEAPSQRQAMEADFCGGQLLSWAGVIYGTRLPGMNFSLLSASLRFTHSSHQALFLEKVL